MEIKTKKLDLIAFIPCWVLQLDCPLTGADP